MERMTSTGLNHIDMKGFSDAREQKNLSAPQTLESSSSTVISLCSLFSIPGLTAEERPSSLWES